MYSRYLIFHLICLVFLSGCASGPEVTISTEDENQSELQAKLNEIENTQNELQNLVALESDLKQLIALLADESGLQENPENLRHELTVKQYALESDVLDRESEKQDPAEKLVSGFYSRVGVFISNNKALKFQESFQVKAPKLSNFAKIEPYRNSNTSYFVIKLGPFDSIDTAKALCVVFMKQNESCSVDKKMEKFAKVSSSADDNLN